MKASCLDWDIESGRIEALSDTEIDRLPETTLEEFEQLDNEMKARITAFCKREKERLHEQALFVADVAMSYLNAV